MDVTKSRDGEGARMVIVEAQASQGWMGVLSGDDVGVVRVGTGVVGLIGCVVRGVAM